MWILSARNLIRKIQMPPLNVINLNDSFPGASHYSTEVEMDEKRTDIHCTKSQNEQAAEVGRKLLQLAKDMEENWSKEKKEKTATVVRCWSKWQNTQSNIK
ncbi:uncharacterized protein LOC118196420 [Stegodyphus dumicola]|uniref:uncharacterized protein LOC118196420 n=1 Tax=Stegodyphus dumicola TaxID=202533 RepID=UPI0015AAB852|nr:uncharacterized protein LOC118196420 [Stegodyphus dumicola]